MSHFEILNSMDKSSSEKLQRAFVPELDAILGHAFPVLNDGFVRVVDYMGNDFSIVQAARVSYGAGTKKVHEDRGLIRYLLRHKHTTPFEMCELKLHVRVPMDTWRQWIRHRMANVNEYSTRYSVAIDSCQTTPSDGWRIQSQSNRQGSEGYLKEEIGRELSESERNFQESALQLYRTRLEAGVAREQARKDLPLSTYTEAYWKCDLHNLLHFLALRMDDHAQLEIRKYAYTIGHEIVQRWVPITWEAFLDYRFRTMTLSKMEIEILSDFNQKGREEAIQTAIRYGFLEETGTSKKSREREELEEKFRKLGFPIPWEIR